MKKQQIKKIGLILAGGQAKRFGGGKCHALLKNLPLIEWVYRTLRPLVDEIWLSTKKGYVFKSLLFDRVIEDETPFQGPARALARLLSSRKDELFLVAACDQPFLNPSLLRYLIERTLCEGALATICLKEDGQWLPLPGIYRAGICLGRSLRDLGPKERILFLRPEEWRSFDPEGWSFFNINFQEDLQAAELILPADLPAKTWNQKRHQR